MGKASIVRHEGEGLYTILLEYNLARAQQAMTKAQQGIDQLQQKTDELALELIQAEQLRDQRIQAQNDALETYQQEILNTGESAIKLSDYTVPVAEAALQCQRISGDIKRFKGRITALNNAIYQYQQLPDSKEISAWCADYSTELAGTVATAEIPGEIASPDSRVLICPGYHGESTYSEEQHGALQPVLASTAAATFFNLALLPGWQKYKPTYRIGTLTSVNDSDNTGSVSLHPTQSSAQGLDVNLNAELTQVPIVYMECDSEAFEQGDDVLVMFVGQDPDQPRIIGFASHPKTCTASVTIDGLIWKLPDSTGLIEETPIPALGWQESGNTRLSLNSAGQLEAWRNASADPTTERTAPEGFTPASGEAVASMRYLDDDNKLWWFVVTRNDGVLDLVLYQPVDQAGAGPNQLMASIVLPDYLANEPVNINWNSRGRLMVIQVISELHPDHPEPPMSVNRAPEHYSMAFAQFIRIVEITGAGAYADGVKNWGEGISVTVQPYTSPYCHQTASLSVQRTVYKRDQDITYGPDGYYDWYDEVTYYEDSEVREYMVEDDNGDIINRTIYEVIQAPLMLLISEEVVHEVTVISDRRVIDTQSFDLLADTTIADWGGWPELTYKEYRSGYFRRNVDCAHELTIMNRGEVVSDEISGLKGSFLADQASHFDDNLSATDRFVNQHRASVMQGDKSSPYTFSLALNRHAGQSQHADRYVYHVETLPGMNALTLIRGFLMMIPNRYNLRGMDQIKLVGFNGYLAHTSDPDQSMGGFVSTSEPPDTGYTHTMGYSLSSMFYATDPHGRIHRPLIQKRAVQFPQSYFKNFSYYLFYSYKLRAYFNVYHLNSGGRRTQYTNFYYKPSSWGTPPNIPIAFGRFDG